MAIHLLLTWLGLQFFMNPPADYLWPRWQCIFFESLAVSQIGLVATWLAIGNAPFLIRFSGGVVVIALWLKTLSYVRLTQEYWILLLLIQVGGIYFFFGAALEMKNVKLTDLQDVNAESRRQFTLTQMFVCITASACVLRALNSIPVPHPSQFQFGELPRALALGILFAAVVLILAWAVLGNNRRVAPTFAVIAVVLGASFAAGGVDQLVRRNWWSSLSRTDYMVAYCCWVTLSSFITFLSFVVLRVCGYRLKKGNPV